MNARSTSKRFLGPAHQRELAKQAKVRADQVPEFARTVGAMMDSDTPCIVECEACGFEKQALLAPIIEKFGRDYSLWNRHPTCKQCGSPMRFLYLNDGSYRPMAAGG